MGPKLYRHVFVMKFGLLWLVWAGCMISTNKNNKNEASVLPSILAAKSTGNAANEHYENRKSNEKTAKKRYRLVTARPVQKVVSR